MATITTSPKAQGVSLAAVRKQYPTLSNHAQVAVWKYGFEVCVKVAHAEDDGALRGMQRDAAKKAGAELLQLAPMRSDADIIGDAPIKIHQKPVRAANIAEALLTPKPAKPATPAPAPAHGAPRPYTSAHTAKATAAPQQPRSSAHTAKFTAKQLATMQEIAASARKHATK